MSRPRTADIVTRPVSLILTCIGVCALPLPLAAAPSAIQPGYWESTNKLLSPIHQTKVEKRCITAADVDKFMAGPSNRHYACTYPTRVIAGGVIRLKGLCVSKSGQKVAVRGAGTYTPTSGEILTVGSRWNFCRQRDHAVQIGLKRLVLSTSCSLWSAFP